MFKFLTLIYIFLVQSLCFAQGVPKTDWEFRAKGDTVITIRTIDFFPDTLFSRIGKMIALSNDSIFVISETDATIPEYTRVSILHLDIKGKLSQHYYSSTSSIRKTNRNINILQNSRDVLWWFAMDQFGAMGTSGNRNIKNLQNHGWVKNPYYDVTQSYLQKKSIIFQMHQCLEHFQLLMPILPLLLFHRLDEQLTLWSFPLVQQLLPKV